MNNKVSQRFSFGSSGKTRWIGLFARAFIILWCGVATAAQPAKPDRIGAILLGEVFATLVDGLHAGLKEAACTKADTTSSPSKISKATPKRRPRPPPNSSAIK